MAEKQALEEEIKRALKEVTDANNSMDTVAFTKWFTNDCCYMAPGEVMVQGNKETAQRIHDTFREKGIANLVCTHQDMFMPCNGESVVERITFSYYDKAATCLCTGKGLVLWVKEDGQWKIKWDQYNSDGE